jgi:hypothetical protein
MKFSFVAVPAIFAAVIGPLYAEPIYLVGAAGDLLSHSRANSINAGNLVVGTCLPDGYIDFLPCYWDLNEVPVLLTDPLTMVSGLIFNPHDVPSVRCAFAGSEIADIDNSGQILGSAITVESHAGCTQYSTGQLPAFTGWSALPDLSAWTHVAALANSNWIVTNGHNPFEPFFELARIDNAVPEPSTLSLMAIALGLLTNRASSRRRRRAS